MASMKISLPEQMHQWVQAQIGAGKYASGGDYIRNLIRQDQERRNKVAELQREIEEGTRSGKAEDFDFARFRQAMPERQR